MIYILFDKILINRDKLLIFKGYLIEGEYFKTLDDQLWLAPEIIDIVYLLRGPKYFL